MTDNAYIEAVFALELPIERTDFNNRSDKWWDSFWNHIAVLEARRINEEYKKPHLIGTAGK